MRTRFTALNEQRRIGFYFFFWFGAACVRVSDARFRNLTHKYNGYNRAIALRSLWMSTARESAKKRSMPPNRCRIERNHNFTSVSVLICYTILSYGCTIFVYWPLGMNTHNKPHKVIHVFIHLYTLCECNPRASACADGVISRAHNGRTSRMNMYSIFKFAPLVWTPDTQSARAENIHVQSSQRQFGTYIPYMLRGTADAQAHA